MRKITLQFLWNIVTGLGMLMTLVIYVVLNEHTKLSEKSEAMLQHDALEYSNDKYHIIPNIVAPRSDSYVPEDTEITICTQTSISNLHHIKNLSETWDGMISVAVFSVDDEVGDALHYILLLHSCSVDIQRKTSFHLVYPTSHPPKHFPESGGTNYDCGELSLLKVAYERENFYPNPVGYPVNYLRNVALMYSSSPYVLNLDVDFLPSAGLKVEMESFLNQQNDSETRQKIAYVLPCFESKMKVGIDTKSTLIEAVKRGGVRQFTFGKCYHCHVPTNYSRWLALAYPSQMSVAYYAKYMLHYEPFYVAKRTLLPMFDNRFKNYGYERFSQICEAYVSGFDFAVMNNAFVVHDGFKDPKQFYKWKQVQHRRNRHLFNTVFRKHLERKYPKSSRKC